ncbi:MAG: CDP-alcohol phosphatidyltransferase family protein [Candidatus Binataceae bacterium]
MLDTILGRHPAIKRAQSRAAHMLFSAGLSPNRATAAGLAAGVIAGAAFGANVTGFGIAMLLVSAALDALDGTIARECAAAPTVLGGIFDLCSDRVVETAVLIGIAWRRPELYFPALVLIGSWYVNITVFLATGAALKRGTKLIAYPPGLVERAEAIVLFIVLAILRPFGPWLCYIYTALELATGTQRVFFALTELRRE